MRTVTALLILFFIVTESFGQVKFEKGYIINNDNKRIECLIKNRDWKYNPTEFSYKLKASGTPETGDITSVKEFGIYNYYKFVGADVKIDRSANPKMTITTDKDPIWKQEKLFLKVLLEGKAKLYSYDSNNGIRFFYSVDGNPISQLVYKEYKVDMSLVKNTSYWQQLWKDLQYNESSMDVVKNIDYNSKDLEAYFKSYNISFGDSKTEISHKARESYLNLKITPGVNFSSASMSIPVESVNGNIGYSKVNYDPNIAFRAGLEAEWVFSYNNYKWAVVFEPTFQSYNSNSVPDDGTIDYKSMEFPLGVRYYYHLSDQTRLYLNGFYVPGFAMNFGSQVKYKQTAGKEISVDVKSSGNMALGGGVDYNKFSMEARYYTNRTLSDAPFLDPGYSRFSIIIGYKIFSTKH